MLSAFTLSVSALAIVANESANFFAAGPANFNAAVLSVMRLVSDFFAVLTESSTNLARSTSYTQWPLPKLQCAFLPFASQAGNSPPISVN